MFLSDARIHFTNLFLIVLVNGEFIRPSFIINFAISCQYSHYSSEKQNQQNTTHEGGGGRSGEGEKERDPEPYSRKLASPYLPGKSAG